MKELLQDYMNWLSSQNGGIGSGSTEKHAQAFLYGIEHAINKKVPDNAKALHKAYMTPD